MIDLDELERLEKEATPGPWIMVDDGFYGGINNESDTGPGFGGERYEGRIEPDDVDAIFVIATRNALPALIRELRSAREVANSFRAYCDDFADEIGVKCPPEWRRIVDAVKAYDEACK